jgi:hypothetical protein
MSKNNDTPGAGAAAAADKLNSEKSPYGQVGQLCETAQASWNAAEGFISILDEVR